MGGFFSAPSIPAPPPPPPLPEPVDPDKEAREARIKAMIRRRRGRAGLVATGDRGVLTASSAPNMLATRLGE
ncbi:MAG: hypothetical protein JNL71_03065 [Rhodospirillales bacterium]|nr:hypothetical protein [Rhodospirillales bacterium]